MAVINLVSEAMGTIALELLDSKTWPVSSLTTMACSDRSVAAWQTPSVSRVEMQSAMHVFDFIGSIVAA
jgi:hypothetical protein